MAGLAFLIFWGCGGGGDGGSSTNPALLGRAEGYAFLQSGIIVLSNSPTPPAGATALSGATITVDGKSGSVTTDSTGHFTVADVPVGQRKLHLSGGGTTLDVPLTVIGAATIPIGTFVVSRTQAIDAAKTAVAGLGSLANFQILAAQQPLPSGAVVKPALGDDDGKDSTALTVTTATAQWFVFVDQQPGARFQHPAVFVFIDANTGAVTTRSVSSWPRINSVHHYSDDDKNATAQDLVQVGTRKVLPTSGSQVVSDLQRIKPRLVTRDHVAGATNPKTYALLIDGNSRSDMFADLDNVQRQLFGPSGLSGPSEIKTWSPPETVNLNAVKQIKILFDDICAKARPEDTVLIYISSHGSKSGAIYIQQGIQSDESVTEDDFLFPYIDLNTSKCAACHVIFIVDTCYAGASMVDMAVKSPPHAGQKLTYIAASSSAETSGGITRYAHARTGKAAGGVFTNAFLNGLKDFSEANGGANQGNLQRIFDDAVKIMDSTTQHPQTVFKWDGMMCGAAPTLVTVTPTEIIEKHTVGSTSCPQTLPTISLKNISDYTVSYSASSGSSYFNLGSGSGSLSPGQSKSLGLSFNCGKVPPLSSSISISASYGSINQNLSIPITLNSGP